MVGALGRHSQLCLNISEISQMLAKISKCILASEVLPERDFQSIFLRPFSDSVSFISFPH